MTPTPANPPAADPTVPMPETQTSNSVNGALLTVNVPNQARVVVNGIPTRSKGSQRRYVSKGLTPGFSYTYEVKAEANVDGKPVVQTKTVQLRAGEQANLAFDFAAPSTVETSLTLHVPEDAKVYLAGNETKGNGPIRTFRTTRLADGKSWNDYAIRVVVDEQNLSKEKVITLQAGDERELTFDFDVDKVAAAR